MKKITFIVLFIIGVMMMAFIMLPIESFSELENRALASNPDLTMDDLLSGTYMEDKENYISDHFPLRNTLMYIRTFVYKTFGISNINDVYLGKDGYLLDSYNMIDYQNELVNSLNTFHDNNPDININIMLLPNKISIYEDKLPSNVQINNQKEEIDNIYKQLHSNIHKIKTYDTLVKEKDNYNLYYKTDHHWTMYGAYFGYQEYCKINNLAYHQIKDYDVQTITDSFRGSSFSKVTDYSSDYDKIDLLTYSNDKVYVEYTDTQKLTNTLYNFDYLKKKDKYSIFLDNNHSLIKITNNTTTSDDNLLIIKDSFANTLVPFLVNHYKKIDIIDPRYYKRSITKYIEDNQIKNVLFVFNLGTLSIDKNITSIR